MENRKPKDRAHRASGLVDKLKGQTKPFERASVPGTELERASEPKDRA